MEDKKIKKLMKTADKEADGVMVIDAVTVAALCRRALQTSPQLLPLDKAPIGETVNLVVHGHLDKDRDVWIGSNIFSSRVAEGWSPIVPEPKGDTE